MKTFCIITLGCKVNQYDSQLIREGLRAGGFRERGIGEGRVDLCVVNTCAVTGRSESKSRRAVRRAARLWPGAEIIVTGCSAEGYPDDFASLPGVSRVIGNAQKAEIAEIAGCREAGPGPVRSITGFSGRTRAFVKIQDGCDFACSYCVVPRLRGRSRSRPFDEVLGEVEELVRRDYNEIVLTGIHLGAYGRDRGEKDYLPRLIRACGRLDGLARVRLSSIEPGEVTEEIVDLMADGGKLCPHLHIPLQSADDRVLEAMRRPYRAADFISLVERLRERIPLVSLGTDIMVGFPLETEEAFVRSCDLVREAEFSRVHVFPYSPRPETEALSLGDRVPQAEKRRRREALAAAARESARTYHARFVGRSVEALVEEDGPGPGRRSLGLTREYLRVAIEGGGCRRGELCQVRVERLDRVGLIGRMETEKN